MDFNIQPSLIIWTVICFGLLMLVLDRLLFRPLLKLMDERREKVDAAKRDTAAAALDRERGEAERLEAERAERNRLIEEDARLAAEFRKKADEELKELSSRLESEAASNREAAEQEAEEAYLKVVSGLDEAAKAYSQKLLKGGQH